MPGTSHKGILLPASYKTTLDDVAMAMEENKGLFNQGADGSRIRLINEFWEVKKERRRAEGSPAALSLKEPKEKRIKEGRRAH